MAIRLGSLRIKQLSLENLYNAYFGMSPREQTAALVAAAIVIVLVVVLPIWGASSRIGRLEQDFAQGKKQFRDVIKAVDSYNARRAELEGLQKMMSSGFDAAPLTTITSIASRDNITDIEQSPKNTAPSDIIEESAVDVRIKRIRLDPLIKFLYAIENDPEKLLRIKTLKIETRFDNKQDLQTNFTVSTFKLIEGAQEGT